MPKRLTLRINGQECDVEVEPDELLVDVLRDRLWLTGTKKGCGTGDCGACTVLMDGRPVTSCLVLAAAAEGRSIETIEGMAQDERLHPLQEAFIEHGAVQCGYCIPGLLIMGRYILDHNPRPNEAEVRAGIAGNLCRCTGYSKVVQAILAAAERMRSGQGGDVHGQG